MQRRVHSGAVDGMYCLEQELGTFCYHTHLPVDDPGFVFRPVLGFEHLVSGWASLAERVDKREIDILKVK